MRKSICLLLIISICSITALSNADVSGTEEEKLLYYVNTLLPVTPEAELLFYPIADGFEAHGATMVTKLRILDTDLRVRIVGSTSEDETAYYIFLTWFDEDMLPLIDSNEVDVIKEMCPGLNPSNPNLTVLNHGSYIFMPLKSDGEPDDFYSILYLAKSKEIFQDDHVYQISLSFRKATFYLNNIRIVRIP